MIKKIKDEIQLSRFDVIDFLDDGETVIAFLRLAIAEGDEDFIAKAIKDVARGYDKIKEENKNLKKKLEITTKGLNGICDIARITNRKARTALKDVNNLLVFLEGNK